MASDTTANSAYNPFPLPNAPKLPLKCPGLGVHRNRRFRISTRTLLNDDTITLHGWPSLGGIIVSNATPLDFDFLRLDPLDPPLGRAADQDPEDAFCKALLRLGATWWDSEARRRFVEKLEDGDEEAWSAFDADEALEPMRRECGWVRVAWPESRPPGSLCVLTRQKVVIGRSTRGRETL
ncbi:hypothetical protein BCR34DRAFT_132914 [Clohesyomyces aquaticus]|uniref:Uncharacterized protein n=1 Tax=Clohesyomyces aquaticus TaxID=1231657 RepID=A0A1Y2AAE9_9PLEO|nr:hypothetical protein BCR34DRAFT_132914 [Clohesyomyces aquaticus]